MLISLGGGLDHFENDLSGEYIRSDDSFVELQLFQGLLISLSLQLELSHQAPFQKGGVVINLLAGLDVREF
ncbi:MAG: hypothetical protein EOP84_12260 [Verrucomicrobiaceae bacterium]|nr:MAG: hypothetical protein EOP84_12260 [Verrucomicrobiaceae bacterium]